MGIRRHLEGGRMAFRKAGSRRITVDGVTYRWRFPPRPTQDQQDGWPGVAVTISRADCRSAPLLLAFPQRFHLNGPVGEAPPRPGLPADVARGIRAALAARWRAGGGSPPRVHRARGVGVPGHDGP